VVNIHLYDPLVTRTTNEVRPSGSVRIEITLAEDAPSKSHEGQPSATCKLTFSSAFKLDQFRDRIDAEIAKVLAVNKSGGLNATGTAGSIPAASTISSGDNK